MTTLLIVDDSREMRQLIKSILSKTCEKFFECEDGDEVLASFHTYRPDWVLMDVEMRRMDGIKATAELKLIHPDAKVIILTKYADAETREAAYDAGARYFVGKDDLLCLRALIQAD